MQNFAEYSYERKKEGVRDTGRCSNNNSMVCFEIANICSVCVSLYAPIPSLVALVGSSLAVVSACPM